MPGFGYHATVIRRDWPEWLEWELVFASHLLRRMRDRGFTEVDLRRMLTDATNYRPGSVPGRWVVECQHEHSEWHVIVEPDFESRLLLVVTAFRVD